MPTINNNPTGQYNSPILSSTGVGSAYDDASRQLNDFTSGADPYAHLFETMTANNKVAQDNAIATATATAERSNQQTQQNENQYNAGLATEGVQSGANRYLPTYQAGLVDQAHQTYMGRYRAITDAEKLAVAQATEAKQAGDVKTMQAKLEYVQQLRKAKADAMEKALNMQWEREKFKQQMALQWHQENRLGAAGKAASSSFFSQAYDVLKNKGRTSTGIPYVAPDGRITFEGFKDIVRRGVAAGVKREDIINNFKSDLVLDSEENALQYGITANEFAKL